MYANLAVSIGRKPIRDGRYDEEVSAWAVEVDGTTATVMLDAQDGEATTPQPAGEQTVDLTTHVISIAADF